VESAEGVHVHANGIVTLNGSRLVHWSYPEIYDREKQDSLEIALEHTRAADSIRIKYDSQRDGWVIEQASKFEWDEDEDECDSDWQEVAFIKAWARGNPP